jgi:hypothetical protein
MTRKVLITIISDQTIQNVQFIREFYDIENYVFITSEKMERKGCSDWIISALEIKPEKVQRISVREFDAQNINDELKNIYNLNDYYLVNITGGTKLMSFAVKEFFEATNNAEVFYLTGYENTGFENQILCLYPKEKVGKKALSHDVNLQEYLKSYGISIKKQSLPAYSFEISKSFFELFTTNDLSPILRGLRDSYQKDQKKKIELSEISGLDDVLNKIGFKLKNGESLDGKEIEYLTGKWLEEYTYYLIKERLNLNESEIGLGVLIEKKGIEQTNNDIDVIFTLRNQLHVIECKTSHFVPISDTIELVEEKPKEKSSLTEYIYKLDSLRKVFGIFAQAYIFTLSKFDDLEKLTKTDAKNEQLKREQVLARLSFHNIRLLTFQKDVLSKFQSEFNNWLQSLKPKS